MMITMMMMMMMVMMMMMTLMKIEMMMVIGDLGSQFLPCLIFFLSRNINAALIHRVIAKDDGLGEMLLLVAKMNKIKAHELLRISVGSSL